MTIYKNGPLGLFVVVRVIASCSLGGWECCAIGCTRISRVSSMCRGLSLIDHGLVGI
jgi:hypothetical protein